MPSTSGSSLETMSTATPSAASCESRWCTSAFVPTSMPRVGSSTRSTRGVVASHFASTTFCWLPPDRVETGSLRPADFTYRRLVHVPRLPPLGRPAQQAETAERPAPGQRRVALHRQLHDQALLASILRHEGDAGRDRRGGTARPEPHGRRPAPRPRRSVSMPKTARMTSLRPAPTRPASADDLTGPDLKLTSLNTPWRVRPRTSSSTSPGSVSCLG